MSEEIKEKQEETMDMTSYGGNGEKSKFNKNFSIAIIILLCCAIVVFVFYIIANNNSTREAIARIDLLCDNVRFCDTDTDISKIYNLDISLKEIDSLIQSKKLGNEYVEKYTYCKDYIEDLKLYNEIQKSLNSQNSSEWLTLQENISALKTESVRMKITDDTVSLIKDRVKSRILYNTLKYYEQYVTNKYGLGDVSGTTDSYYYEVPKTMEKAFIMTVPDTSKLGNVPSEGFGAILGHMDNYEDSCQMHHTITDRFISPLPVQDAIKKDLDGGFVVEYIEGGEDKISWVACNFDVETKYEDGFLKISLTDNSGSNTIYMKDLQTLKALSFN